MTDGNAHDDGGDESTRTGGDRNDLQSEDPEHTNADPFADEPTSQGTRKPHAAVENDVENADENDVDDNDVAEEEAGKDKDHANADPFANTPTAQGTPDPESFHPAGDAQRQGDGSGTDTRSDE